MAKLVWLIRGRVWNSGLLTRHALWVTELSVALDAFLNSTFSTTQHEHPNRWWHEELALTGKVFEREWCTHVTGRGSLKLKVKDTVYSDGQVAAVCLTVWATDAPCWALCHGRGQKAVIMLSIIQCAIACWESGAPHVLRPWQMTWNSQQVPSLGTLQGQSSNFNQNK